MRGREQGPGGGMEAANVRIRSGMASYRTSPAQQGSPCARAVRMLPFGGFDCASRPHRASRFGTREASEGAVGGECLRRAFQGRNEA